ncbi:ribosomal protein S18-alanine N-acetyltransferase [Haloechinothrix sp. LS1_15]|uniref:ribosomal protein S18-alanine N-acetyltransferase n=1 Tax=Haloechinothrix sp. LS1_15 TaxID=2652248 RepID=UPI00294864B0|nr:ribosomal protein S18-alanine N-acetyltransferase [Haloechinothrix sp. LS1_15]MDV6013071.1 ribosomal-protein-alanine N-acetyltransferase [Haloechinothrix sp. LS1_15]
MTATGDQAGADPVLAPLRRADVARCVEIERLLFPEDSPWDARAFRAELSSGAYYLGAYDGDGVLLGYGGLGLARRRGTYEGQVHTIGVAPDAQRRGVGRALLERLLGHADEVDAPVYLEVRTDNHAAISLYTTMGFCTIGVRERYYQPSGADAYAMCRPAASAVSGRHCAGEHGAGEHDEVRR